MLNNPDICFSLIEQAAESIFVVDNENRIVFQNPEARRVFGFSDDELLGQPILDMIHHHYPDGSAVPADQCNVYRAVAYGETARNLTWQLKRKDGARFYASCTSSPFEVEGKKNGAIFFVTDITASKHTDAVLRATAEKLQLATEVAGVGLYDYQIQTDDLTCTDTVKEHFGFPPGATVTRSSLLAAIHPDDRERVRNLISEMLNPDSGGRFQYEYRTIRPIDGKERWLLSKGQVFYENGKAVQQVGATVDITERKQFEDGLRQSGHHCPLTGLPDRALLAEFTAHLFAMAARDQAECALLFIDLDRFKPINDLYGHDVGDKVLQETARRLRRSTRSEDIVSRLGGDEFVVVLPHIDSVSDPQIAAQHLIEKISQPMQIGSLQLSVSASIGISLFQKHGRDLETLIRAADLAMYVAKRNGRNTSRMYIPGDEERSSVQLQLEVHLKHALESDAMTLYYQPIVDINSGQLVGVEALIRLMGMKGNLLTPDQFIPIAESAGLIEKLGQWVVKEACRQHQAWSVAGMPPLTIAINVSALEFRQHAFTRHLGEAVINSGIDPNCLQIELTESAIMENIGESIATLNRVRSMGIRVALDDFGTGYSSLSSLHSLPLDKVKIDKSFISKLETSQSSQSITDTLIGLGRLMNVQVVGEGIESVEAMEYLRDHGCSQAQGFYYSKPLPADELESWYRARNKSLH